jgi:predicted dehydrogenase
VNNNEIRVATVGAGAFGRNHARVYHELQQQGSVRLAAVVDADGARAKSIATPLGAEAFTSVSDMLAHTSVDAASVAVPTVHHLAVARELMQRGIDVLIEKPIATSLSQADELIQLAQQHDRVAMVGHLERFNPAVRAALGVITQPMFFEVHRLSIFGPRALDVDVVLDLMIHDIDIVLTMTRSPVREVRAVGLPILSGKVDIANVRLEFESGCVANLTASRVSTERVRKLRLFQPRQYVSLDYTRQDVLVLTVNTDVLRSGAVNAEALMSLIKPEKPPVEQEEPLKAEIRAFLNAVRSRQTPAVTLEQGRAALEVALQVLAAIQGHSDRLGLAAMLK